MVDVIFEDDFVQGIGIFVIEGWVYIGNYGIWMWGGVVLGFLVILSVISIQGYENLVL